MNTEDQTYAEIVAGLPRKPESCCGSPRVRFHVDGYFVYACSACEAAPWDLHEGVFHGPLRAACDPAWSWVPAAQRAAVARYGMFGATAVEGASRTPLYTFDVVDGRVWVADRANGLLLDADETWLPAMREQASRTAANAEVVRGRIAGVVTAPGYVKSAAPDVPFALVVDELYPGATWMARPLGGPLVAWLGRVAVALAMPTAA